MHDFASTCTTFTSKKPWRGDDTDRCVLVGEDEIVFVAEGLFMLTIVVGDNLVHLDWGATPVYGLFENSIAMSPIPTSIEFTKLLHDKLF